MLSKSRAGSTDLRPQALGRSRFWVWFRYGIVRRGLRFEDKNPLHGPTATGTLNRTVGHTVNKISDMYLELDVILQTAIESDQMD